ncbi:MAG: hypothetical protein H0W78_01450 [Planctomycetes bacterium]|nr:hypothetical protein [Planctomycetota bacterium]
MDVSLIKAINDFYQFDLDVGQEEIREHLRQTLHLDERSATLAMAELIANNYLTVTPKRATCGSRRMQALVSPGPKLVAHAAEAS